MTNIVFDTGPIISLALNNLLWILNPLKKKLKGNFYICESAKKELIDNPLKTKKFKFEALQVLNLIDEGILEVVESERLKEDTERLLRLANETFSAHGNNITIVQKADIEGIACCFLLSSDAYVVDERTVRILIEDCKRLKQILQGRSKTNVMIDRKKLKEFQEDTKHVKIIRSVEIATVAYEIGCLNKYLANVENPKETLLEGVLWGLKLNGCAVSSKEINQIMKKII